MIKFSSATLDKRPVTDILIIPFWKEKGKPKPAVTLGKLEKQIQKPVEFDDFDGTHGKISLLYSDGIKEKRLLLLGLGEKDEITVERLRRACAEAAKECRKYKAKKAAIINIRTNDLTVEDCAEGVAEGFLLVNYTNDQHRGTSQKEKPILLTNLTLIEATNKEVKVAEKFANIAEGVYLARDLVNGNADDVTPQYLSTLAKNLGKKDKNIKVTILDKKAIEKEKMGLIQAVSRGGRHDPALIIIEYRGNPKSKDKTVLIGKGVTFDTGGLNLKTTGHMETMKCDMSGAAAVLGTMKAIASLKAKVNVTAVIPATENAIDAHSYKPGDVYMAYDGTTVEIGNTDAEGRLILADAIAYTVRKLKPSRIIDIATLTGAIVIALGDETSGLMSSNDVLADSLLKSGWNTYERLWRLPIFPEYREQLKSDIADIRNIGGRSAGSITASLFLKEFTKDIPWAHIDIAGTAYLDKCKRYHPQHATGVGVRLFVDFLLNQ